MSMGRSRIDITEPQLRELWERLRTSKRIAKELGCHPQTVKNYTKLFGITGLSRGYKHNASPIRSKFAKWLVTYRGEIPYKVKDLMELSGCTKSQIVNYMYRLRQASRDLINSQPWRHNGPPVLWTDIKGVNIPDHAFDVVRAQISRFGTMRFQVRLKNKEVRVFQYTLDQLRQMYCK